MSEQILSTIARYRLLPVVVLKNTEAALPLGRALIDGGLPIAEVTFRTSAAEASIRAMAETYPEMMVGAGTVLTTDQVDRAVGAGAKFILSPGFNPVVVDYCLSKGILMMPGVNSPTDVEMAMSRGLRVVKFFPAEASGGIPFIKALSSPYSEMRFIPTGGIGRKNLADYLALPSVIACGGSWIVDAPLVEAGRFDEVARLTKEAMTSIEVVNRMFFG